MLRKEKVRRLAVPDLRLTIKLQQARKHSTGIRIDMYQQKKTIQKETTTCTSNLSDNSNKAAQRERSSFTKYTTKA